LKIAAVLAALGGRSNIAEVHLSSSRLCISVRDPAKVDESILLQATRAVARLAPDKVHLGIGPGPILVRRHDGFPARSGAARRPDVGPNARRGLA
jgi:phosphotransferase system IIB component